MTGQCQPGPQGGPRATAAPSPALLRVWLGRCQQSERAVAREQGPGRHVHTARPPACRPQSSGCGEGNVTPFLLFISNQVAPTQGAGWREQRAPGGGTHVAAGFLGVGWRDRQQVVNSDLHKITGASAGT